MDANSQRANDVHFLTAPLRFVLSLVRAAIFLAIFPLVILGLCFHAALIGGPIMDDDMWLLTKVLFCVLAPFALALIAGIFSNGSLVGAWAKEFLVLILSFVAVAGLLRYGVITFNDSDHAPHDLDEPAVRLFQRLQGRERLQDWQHGKWEVRVVL